MEAEASRERRCDKIVEEGGTRTAGRRPITEDEQVRDSEVEGEPDSGERGETRSLFPLFGDPLQNP